MSVHQIWAAVVTAFIVVSAVVTLSIYKIDAQNLILVITAVVSPIVSALVVSAKVQRVSEKVDVVDQKVNGHLTALTNKIPDVKVGE